MFGNSFVHVCILFRRTLRSAVTMSWMPTLKIWSQRESETLHLLCFTFISTLHLCFMHTKSSSGRLEVIAGRPHIHPYILWQNSVMQQKLHCQPQRNFRFETPLRPSAQLQVMRDSNGFIEPAVSQLVWFKSTLRFWVHVGCFLGSQYCKASFSTQFYGRVLSCSHSSHRLLSKQFDIESENGL